MLLQVPLRGRNFPTDGPIQDGRLIDPITPGCGPALPCLSFSLAEITMLKKFVIIFYEIKLFFTILTLLLVEALRRRDSNHFGKYRKYQKAQGEVIVFKYFQIDNYSVSSDTIQINSVNNWKTNGKFSNYKYCK